MEQSKWINEVLESTKGMQKAEPGPFLFEKVTSRINKAKTSTGQTSPVIKWAFAVSAVVIISLNTMVIADYGSNETTSNSDSELVSDLSTQLGYNSNYNY